MMPDTDGLKNAIEYIFERGKENARSLTVNIDGKDHTFASDELNLREVHPDPLPPELPLMTVFKVRTLSGFVDLLKNGFENTEESAENYFVHVVDERTVQLVARESDQWMRRPVIIQASAFDYQQFPFGRQLTQEEFIINFQTRFVPDDGPDSDYSYVLRIAQNLTASLVGVSDDTGITQETVIRSSISGRKEVALRPRVNLAPFRTFQEVAQPSSAFLFRLHKMGTEEKPAIPYLSLHESDGGNWKLEAMSSIKLFLTQNLESIPVIC